MRIAMVLNFKESEVPLLFEDAVNLMAPGLALDRTTRMDRVSLARKHQPDERLEVGAALHPCQGGSQVLTKGNQSAVPFQFLADQIGDLRGTDAIVELPFNLIGNLSGQRSWYTQSCKRSDNFRPIVALTPSIPFRDHNQERSPRHWSAFGGGAAVTRSSHVHLTQTSVKNPRFFL